VTGRSRGRGLRQRRNFYQVRAEVTHRGHYYHEYCMAISVERDSQTWQDMTADAEVMVTEALRDLARWPFRQLEREYDYLSSDEAVDETIRPRRICTTSGRPRQRPKPTSSSISSSKPTA